MSLLPSVGPKIRFQSFEENKHILTISTPCLSARVMNTKKVDKITDINGAIAGSQKNLLFFFPCAHNMKE